MLKQNSTIISEYHLNRHMPDRPQFTLHNLSEYLKTNQCQVAKPHIHSFYQIIWFKKGKGNHAVDFKTYDVCDNTIFFIAPNQVHHFDDYPGNEGILIHFNQLFLIQNESPIDFMLNSSLFNNAYQQPSCFITSEIVDILNSYVSQIRQELENEEPFGKELILANYLKSFLIQIQRLRNLFDQTGHFSTPIFDEKRMKLMRFIDLIGEHYKTGFSVSEYARSLHISSRSLSDLTQHYLNKTPSQMIQERIVLEAQRLLLYSELNINQVGYQLGFDDPSYFVKYFKKHTNFSPSEFKKLNS